MATKSKGETDMADKKLPKGALDSTLVGRKVTAKYSHMWFNASQEFMAPLPTDQGMIVAAFTSREDGETAVKVVVESEKGDTRTFYIESLMLVPESKKT